MTECSTDEKFPSMGHVDELKKRVDFAIDSGMDKARAEKEEGDDSAMATMGVISFAAEAIHILLGAVVSIAESQRHIAAATDIIADEAEMTMKDVEGTDGEDKKTDWRDDVMS